MTGERGGGVAAEGAAGHAKGFLHRLDAVTERLAVHAVARPPTGLTEADASTGERWDWGQIWAHLAEFPAYWMGQIRAMLEIRGSEPVPFGRISSDPARIAAIERQRSTEPATLWDHLSNDLDELRSVLVELSPAQWEALGVHRTLGVMDLPKIVDQFLVGHLEAHADQLDQLGVGDGRRPNA
jgi:hypothetical protein